MRSLLALAAALVAVPAPAQAGCPSTAGCP